MIGAAYPSIAQIQSVTAAAFHIPLFEMTSHRRFRSVARPRQVAMYWAHRRTPYSLPQIGRLFGGRDHTTVIHAIKTVERLIGEDKAFARKVRACGKRIVEVAA